MKHPSLAPSRSAVEYEEFSSRGGEFVEPNPNIFVFHLPSDVDDVRLRSIFTPLGEILNVKVRIVKNFQSSVDFVFPLSYCKRGRG